MPELDLLRALPKGKRNIQKRADTKSAEVIAISRRYGQEYFDGPRNYGYGGYRYDGRWVPVARDVIAQYGLKAGDRVLDIGCAKGFLVKDLIGVCPGLEAFGLDISEYALMHCEPEIVGRLHLGTASKLPFPDKSFDVILAINTVHNLEKPELIRALREIGRVARRGSFVQVDSYRTPEEREIFVDWVLTAYTHDYPDGWKKIFQEAGYDGDYYWTFITG